MQKTPLQPLFQPAAVLHPVMCVFMLKLAESLNPDELDIVSLCMLQSLCLQQSRGAGPVGMASQHE